MSDAKLVNTEAYDHLADWYLSWVSAQTSPRERYAAKILESYDNKTDKNISKSSSSSPPPPTEAEQRDPPYILELGCGPGLTTHQLLSAGAHVLANDISPAQIAMAKTRCHDYPSRVTFAAGDMAALSIPNASLDGCVCFFTLFHLPRAEQKPMLSKISDWLKVGGLLVCNFATFDEEEIYGEMMGRGIFWSGFGVEENRAMLLDAGFEIEGEEVLESEADGGNEFLWVVARKRGVVLDRDDGGMTVVGLN
jgi:SAM-dependent methyltransferase